jgi:hypothetical protein
MSTFEKPTSEAERGKSGPESPAKRAQRLLTEARSAAFEHTRNVDQALERVIAHAAEIASGGDVYPASVRDLCARLAEEAAARRELLNSLAARSLRPGQRPPPETL